jgi:plasmid maintenance system killer protein
LISELENEKSKLLQKLEQIRQSKQNSTLDSLETSFFTLKLEREKKLEEQSITLNSKNLISSKYEEDIDNSKRDVFELEELFILLKTLNEERICSACIDQ